MFIFGCEDLKPVLLKTKKNISKLFLIWTLLLLFILEGVFPEPAYAFLSSLDACAVQPECAEAIGLELSPTIAASTAEAAGTTAISTTTTTKISDPPQWKDWPQEKRNAAVQLLNNSDWQGLISSMPAGGILNPGDKINAPTIVIPGQETDDPNTPADERLLKKESGFFTLFVRS